MPGLLDGHELGGGLPAMHRLLATAIFAYAGLSAAQWGHATRWLHAPPDVLWCGNVVSDPFTRIVNVHVPLAAAASFVLVRRCIKVRRWPCYAVTALLAFVVTSACLAYEAHFLGEYGFEFGRIWWLPWR
jgi:hypothetical protein